MVVQFARLFLETEDVMYIKVLLVISLIAKVVRKTKQSIGILDSHANGMLE